MNAKRGRRLLRKERQRTTLKMKAHYGRRVLQQSNVSGLNTDAGIQASSVRKTRQKICKILTDLNRDSGLGTIRGSHKDSKSLYGGFQFRREWFSYSELIHNMVGSCPMRDRCRCQCEFKSAKDATTVVFLIENAHTSQDHEKEQDIK